MSEIKECLFYIDHNPPKHCGTWNGAIHKGACKMNSTDCKDTDKCFIKNLYNQLRAKEQELADLKEFCEKLKKSNSNYATAVLKRNFKLEKIKEYLNSCNLKADFTACDVLQIIEGNANE